MQYEFKVRRRIGKLDKVHVEFFDVDNGDKPKKVAQKVIDNWNKEEEIRKIQNTLLIEEI